MHISIYIYVIVYLCVYIYIHTHTLAWTCRYTATEVVGIHKSSCTAAEMIWSASFGIK